MKNDKSHTVFNSRLNNYCRKYLVKNFQLNREEIKEFENVHNAEVASIFEQMLLFDKVSFKVYGENIPLAVLLNNLGINNFEKLLDEDVFEFVLWTPIVTHLDSDIPGLMPLQSGNLSSPAHSDPSESIQLGFDWMRTKPDRKTRRALQRKIEKKYIIPSKEFSKNAAETVMQAYSKNKLSEFGMPKDKDIVELIKPERSMLCRYADDILEASILAQYKYCSFENHKNYVFANIGFNNIKNALKIKNNFNQILKTEKIPDIKSLLLNNHIKAESLVEFRKKRIVREFRSWLNSASLLSDSDDIIKEYIGAITENKGFFETNKGKFIKTISMYGIGAGIGALVGGASGAIISGSATKILEPILDLGLDLLDIYLLDGLLKGWNPKIFINEFELLING